jgi:hypothetical protein
MVKLQPEKFYSTGCRANVTAESYEFL